MAVQSMLPSFFLLVTLSATLAAPGRLLANEDTCQCGIENVSPRIINGRTSEPYTFPWVVFIEEKRPEDTSSCTGSIISSQFILTAAHCVPDDNDARYMKVYTYQGCDRPDAMYTAAHYSVRKIHRHPDFNWQMGNGFDVAILELDQPIALGASKEVMPICLTRNAQSLTNHVVAGWGLTNSDYWKMESSCLLEADLELVSNYECRRAWPNAEMSRVLCGGGRVNVCQGDSGGPLMGRANGLVFQAGTMSHGRQDCGILTRTPSVFERTSYHIDWIKKVTASDPVCVKQVTV